MKIDEKQKEDLLLCQQVKISEDQLKSMKFNENQWKSTNIDEKTGGGPLAPSTDMYQ